MNKIQLSTRCYEQTIKTEKEYDETWSWLTNPSHSVGFIYDIYEANVEYEEAQYSLPLELLAYLDWMSLVIQLTRKSPYLDPKESMEEFLEVVKRKQETNFGKEYLEVACELLEECKNV